MSTWREVAELLAARMVNHAYCPENHRPAEPATCPFCADKVAYETFRKKSEE